MYSSELIKGTLKTIVLNMLKKHGRLYGYELTQLVKELTLNKIQITEGALYPTLHALEKDGIVDVEQESFGKRIRKYYMLTEKGKTEVVKRSNELSDFIETMQFLLDLKPKVNND